MWSQEESAEYCAARLRVAHRDNGWVSEAIKIESRRLAGRLRISVFVVLSCLRIDAMLFEEQLPFRGEIHFAMMLFLMIDVVLHRIQVR